MGSWCSRRGLADARGHGGGRKVTLELGPLGSCQFLQLLSLQKKVWAYSTILHHPGVSLFRVSPARQRLVAYPTERNCRPLWDRPEIWTHPSWLVIGKEMAGDGPRGD